jgi:hypothetical protein
LHFDEEKKKLAVDLDQPASGSETFKKAYIVRQINRDQAKQRKEKAEHKQPGLELRTKQSSPRIAKKHKAARPRRSERARI